MAEVRWECGNATCLHKTGWWLSAQGVVFCRNCVPPAFPALVVAEGTTEDAPLVTDTLTTVVVSKPESSAGRAMWLLRGDRTPEKVEVTGKRRKVQVPPDVTHWCHEGDREWTPYRGGDLPVPSCESEAPHV